MFIYILYIVIGVLVLISTIVMTWWFNTNRVLNSYLILISCVMCLFLILYGINHTSISLPIYLNFNYHQVVLILTPAVLLFFQNLFSNYKYPRPFDILYFILPILLFRYVGNISSESVYLFRGQYLFFLIYLCIYILLICKLFRVNISNRTDTTKQSSLVNDWAVFIFKMMILVIIHFIIIITGQTFKSLFTLSPSFDFLLLIVFLIGYFKVIFTPELLYGNQIINFTTFESREIREFELKLKNVWTQNKSIDFSKGSRDNFIYDRIANDINKYIDHINQIAFVNFSFRDRDFSIVNLSDELGIPKYYIDFIFKYYCTISFNEFKKLARVYDATHLICNDYLKNDKLDTLARKVGFASYNPFLINFKLVIGVSPYEFNRKRIIFKSDSFIELVQE